MKRDGQNSLRSELTKREETIESLRRDMLRLQDRRDSGQAEVGNGEGGERITEMFPFKSDRLNNPLS